MERPTKRYFFVFLPTNDLNYSHKVLAHVATVIACFWFLAKNFAALIETFGYENYLSPSKRGLRKTKEYRLDQYEPLKWLSIPNKAKSKIRRGARVILASTAVSGRQTSVKSWCRSRWWVFHQMVNLRRSKLYSWTKEKPQELPSIPYLSCTLSAVARQAHMTFHFQALKWYMIRLWAGQDLQKKIMTQSHQLSNLNSSFHCVNQWNVYTHRLVVKNHKTWNGMSWL